MATRALVLGGGGVAGIGWEMGMLVGLAQAGIGISDVDLILGTSAGATVAAQITSGLTMDELFRRQVDSGLLSKEMAVRPDFHKMTADLTRIVKTGGASRDILKAVGALALTTATPSEADRRAVIASRLPVQTWPLRRLEITAIDAFTGERISFNRDSGVDLVDAVAASAAIPCVWPPVTIGNSRYIDGGCYSMSNADLASTFDSVLLLQPDNPTFPVLETLEKQIDRLLRDGVDVQVISPDNAMREAIAARGGNALDLSLRAIGANLGLKQSRQEIARVAALWPS